MDGVRESTDLNTVVSMIRKMDWKISLCIGVNEREREITEEITEVSRHTHKVRSGSLCVCVTERMVTEVSRAQQR